MPGVLLPAASADRPDPRPAVPAARARTNGRCSPFWRHRSRSGFRSSCADHTLKDGPYRLDHLYDYVMASLGPTLFAQATGKTLGRSAVGPRPAARRDRAGNPARQDHRPSAGPRHRGRHSRLRDARLQAALNGRGHRGEIDEAVQSLTRRSVVVFRRHTGSYALWEGSDVDIDDRLQAAARPSSTTRTSPRS